MIELWITLLLFQPEKINEFKINNKAKIKEFSVNKVKSETERIYKKLV